MKNNLPYPFYGPGSKCNLRRLKSGNIIFINNNSNTKNRKNLSAYLSTDDGYTWHDLLIDYRLGCAYPDVTEDDDGYIYVIFDSGRKTRNEIRFTKFKEEDIIASKYISKGNIRLKTISKTNSYRDITKVNLIDENTIKLYLEDNSVLQLNGAFENVLINNKTHTLFNLGEELDNNYITDPFGLLLDLK